MLFGAPKTLANMLNVRFGLKKQKNKKHYGNIDRQILFFILTMPLIFPMEAKQLNKKIKT